MASLATEQKKDGIDNRKDNIVKVGLLTFHEVPNPGALLQALATQRTLEGMGHECSVIHYSFRQNRNRHPMRAFLRLRTYLHLRRRIDITKKLFAFNRAQGELLNRTACCETHADVGRMAFDAVIIGADTVWDFRTPTLGRDPIYFGHHLNAERIIALAPSCAECDPDGDVPDYLRTGIPKFTAIAVRDRNTQKLVTRVLGREPPIIADPAFALDIGALRPRRLLTEPYLFIYEPAELNSTMMGGVRALARRKGLKLVAACYRQPGMDVNRPGAGPMEWLSWVAHADYVLTDCFHGAVFSIATGRPLLMDWSRVVRSKIKAMLERGNFMDRVLCTPESLSEMADRPCDASRSQRVAHEWKNEIQAYLRDALASNGPRIR